MSIAACMLAAKVVYRLLCNGKKMDIKQIINEKEF